MPTKYAKNKKFASLSANERARRIGKIRDPRQRKAAERFWGVERDGGGGFLGELADVSKGIGEFGRNVAKAPNQIASQLQQAGVEVGRAVGRDYTQGRGLIGASRYAGSQLASPISRAFGTYRAPPGPFEGKGRSSVDILGEQLVKGIPGAAADIANLPKWYEQPGPQALNLFGFVLPGVRAASVGRLTQQIAKANKGKKITRPDGRTREFTKRDATVLAINESLRPGFARAQGFKGGIPERQIRGQFGTARGRMPSRQPTIRAAQRAWDKAAERIDVSTLPGWGPQNRWSSSAKAQRLESRRTRARTQETKASRKHLEDRVVEGLLGPGLASRLRRGADLPGRTDRPRAAALVAGLEAPGDLTVREAASLKIQGLRSILEENDQLRPMQDRVDELKTQRVEALAANPDLDTTPLDNEISKLAGQLDVLMGRGVPALSSPARTQVYNQMVTTIGRQAADEQIQQWDLAAWGNDLENPTAFYDKVEVRRLADPEEFRPAAGAYYQRMAGEQGGWFFPLERALEGLQGKRMQAGQLAASLQKAGVRNEELFNSGLGEALADPNVMVDVGDVLGKLNAANYFHRYDPDVRVRSDAEGGTEYGPDDHWLGPVLSSRESANGEYHEMVVDYPNELRTRDMQGSGQSHWNKPNVVYHVRFHRYVDEEGRTAMLVEEIQSDWASDYRRATKQNAQMRPAQETAAERADLEARVTAAVEAHAEAVQRLDELRDQMDRYIDEGTNVNTVPGFLDQMADAREAMAEARYQRIFAEDAIAEFERWEPSRVPPSPMGANRFLDNAVRQVVRWADENDVDYIVLTDGGTQAVRNRKVDIADSEDVTVDDGYQDYGEYVDAETGEPLTNEQITARLKDADVGSFRRQYNEAIPKVFKRLFGDGGEHFDDAYTGRYSAQADPYDYGPQYNGYIQTEESGMPGTVVQLTPDVLRKSREEAPLYQRNPDDGTPLGATEFLENGKRRVTMFKGANATTWSHELVHVLTPDLTPENRAVLEREIAGGKPYAEWGTAEHEKLAKAWDTYWREGYAPPSLREVFADLIRRMKRLWQQTGTEAHEINRATAEVFDRMLGKRYQNSVILKREQVNQVEADIADLQKAIDSGDVDRMEEALDALSELAAQAEQAGVAILTRGKNEAQTAAILEGLRTRKNAVVEDYRRRGLIGDGEDARGYFPHMSMWEGMGEPPSDPVRMAATGDVVGVPKVQPKTVNRNRNRLIRHQTGEVLNDPVVVTYILRARLRLLETIRARSELYAVGQPIEPGRPIMRDMVYVRNPDVQPEKMQAATSAANRLSERDFRDLSARQLADEVDELNDVDGIQDQMFWRFGEGERPDWVTSEENVRVVPRKIAQNRLGDVFRSAPKGNLTAAVGVTNALFRIASIYLRPWRYVPVNYVQNAIMLALTNPSAFTKLVKRDVTRLTKEDPQLRNRIRQEVGTIQATALPEFNVRPQTRLQAAERSLTKGSGQMGEVLGRYADVPIREAAWLNHAERYGFVGADDINRLLDDPDLAEVREIISQRTKEDLIDFDTLTPYEREVMTRYLALWPFIRGITKWPFMYAREYPMRVAVAAGAGGEPPEDELSVLDMGTAEAFGKQFNIGKLDPSAPGREAVQNAVALMRGTSKVAKGEQPDLTAFAGNYLTPGLRDVIGMASGETRKNWVQSAGRTFAPGAGIVLDVKKGGSISDQALRQLGLVRERTDGVKREVKEWMAPLDKITQQIRENGNEPPAVLIQAQKLRAPYGEWKQYESERKFAKRDMGKGDSLTPTERVEGLIDVAKNHYPPLYAQANEAAKANGWESFEQMLEAGTSSEEFLKQVDKYLYEQMFGAMTDIKRQAKEAGLDVE